MIHWLAGLNNLATAWLYLWGSVSVCQTGNAIYHWGYLKGIEKQMLRDLRSRGMVGPKETLDQAGARWERELRAQALENQWPKGRPGRPS